MQVNTLKIDEEFFKEEIRDGYNVSAKMKKVWAVELDMLKKLDEVCKKHNLKYFVDSGTLLGAVRHKGFIPWDDDVDVVMMREDYDKLIGLADEEFKNPYFLQTAYNDKLYLRAHAQLRNSDTTGILPYEGLNVEFNQGIFLDIFPLDEISNINIFRKIKICKLNIYKKMFNIMYQKNMSTNYIKKVLKDYIKNFLVKVFRKEKLINLYKKFENCCRKNYFKSGLVDKVSFYNSYEQYKKLPISYFDETIEVKFENITVPIPKEYDKILKKYYGENYMKPVKAQSMHGNLILEPEKSYKEVLKEMK